MSEVTQSEAGYAFFPELGAEVEIPTRGIHSQTMLDSDGVEVVLFAMAAGERLSEHTSARPAIIHVLQGEGRLTVSGDEYMLAAGAWLQMAIRTSHAIEAQTALVFALYLFAA